MGVGHEIPGTKCNEIPCVAFCTFWYLLYCHCGVSCRQNLKQLLCCHEFTRITPTVFTEIGSGDTEDSGCKGFWSALSSSFGSCSRDTVRLRVFHNWNKTCASSTSVTVTAVSDCRWFQESTIGSSGTKWSIVTGPLAGTGSQLDHITLMA